MALVNRDKDASEQKEVMVLALNSITTVGTTNMIGIVPYPAILQSARVGGFGFSGAPQAFLRINRFAAGTTSILPGISNMIISNIGLSGILGQSGLAATGSTLLQLQAGDVLTIETAVANTAVEKMVAEVVLKKLQDVVSYFGVSS